MTSLFYTGWLMRRNLRPIPSGSGQKLQPEPTPSIFKLSAHAPELKRGDLQPRYFRHLTRIGHPRRPRCSGVIKKGVRRGAGWSIGGLHGPRCGVRSVRFSRRRHRSKDDGRTSECPAGPARIHRGRQWVTMQWVYQEVTSVDTGGNGAQRQERDTVTTKHAQVPWW